MPAKSEPIDQHKAARLKLVREYLGLSQGKLALILNCNQPHVARMEGGTRAITDDITKILFEKYNISPAYMIAGVDDMEYKSDGKKLVKDIASLRTEIEVLKAQIIKMRQDISILSKK